MPSTVRLYCVSLHCPITLGGPCWPLGRCAAPWLLALWGSRCVYQSSSTPTRYPSEPGRTDILDAAGQDCRLSIAPCSRGRERRDCVWASQRNPFPRSQVLCVYMLERLTLLGRHRAWRLAMLCENLLRVFRNGDGRKLGVMLRERLVGPLCKSEG